MSVYTLSAIVSLLAGLVYLADVACRPTVRRTLGEFVTGVAKAVGDLVAAVDGVFRTGVLLVYSGLRSVLDYVYFVLRRVVIRLRRPGRREASELAEFHDRLLARLAAQAEADERAAGPPKRALSILRLASRLISRDVRDRYFEEWRAEIAATTGRRAQMTFAISVLTHAPYLGAVLRRSRKRKTSD